MIQTSRARLSALVLLGVLVLLAGCGRGTGAQQSASGHPDSVRIEIDNHLRGISNNTQLSDQAKPAVTLRDAGLVQQLYATIYALPAMPEQGGGTLELLPVYTLTFSEGSQSLATVVAPESGRHGVTIKGETGSRQSNDAFWKQLNAAIDQALAAAKTDLLAIAYTPQPGQVPQTARIASVETAQRLYNALLALPVLPLDQSCTMPDIPTYQLVFHTAEQQIIPVAIGPSTCKTVLINWGYVGRGGMHPPNDQFNQLFAKIVAGTTFKPAQPDTLLMGITTMTQATSSSPATVSNGALMQQLYHKVLTLQPTTPHPDCAGGDKAAGKGTWYSFAFTQWDLPILSFDAYEGSCMYIVLTGQWVQGDQALWDLIHRAANHP